MLSGYVDTSLPEVVALNTTLCSSSNKAPDNPLQTIITKYLKQLLGMTSIFLFSFVMK